MSLLIIRLKFQHIVKICFSFLFWKVAFCVFLYANFFCSSIACSCFGGVLGVVSCFLIISASAVNSAAAMMAEVAPVMYQACHAGMVVSRYRREPMSMKRDAEPANEMPNAIKTEPTMLTMRSFLMRCLAAVSASLTYSFNAALISFRIAAINSLSDIFIDI